MPEIRDMAMLLGDFGSGNVPEKNSEITTLEISLSIKKKNHNLCLVMFYRCAISTTVRPARQIDMQYPPKYFKMSGLIILKNMKRSLFNTFKTTTKHKQKKSC